MKFIELNNTKLKFFDNEVPYIACDGVEYPVVMVWRRE
jgi:hypothetical protein